MIRDMELPPPRANTIDITTPKCIMCGRQSTINVPIAGFEAMGHGAYVQEAFPDLSPQEREQLIHGTHPDCWDDMMGPEE